jgi:two-component system chemotaxis sensor kinase CheA
MDRLMQAFLAESFEGLDRMDRRLSELDLLEPDHSPGCPPNGSPDRGWVDEFFRTVHTMKGSAGFFQCKRLAAVAHAGEHVLGALRSGAIEPSAEVIDGLLHLTDHLRSLLVQIEASDREEEGGDAEFLALLRALAAGDPLRSPHCAASSTRMTSETAGKTLRIDVAMLDRMLNLVGELVETRNEFRDATFTGKALPEIVHRLDLVTADLRDAVLGSRMQPLSTLFGQYPRMVRDLAQSCGKQVRVELSGQETTLDKSLLEAIRDPLAHALRNAIDHGIETPEERLHAGKSQSGTICLHAFQRHGYVVVEMRDDGAGISPARVRDAAMARNLLHGAQLAAMSDQAVLQLVFLSGFSTAAQVTPLSGRGVGMDVVRSNIERLGGTVELESTAGLGTMLRLRVPLTLAIVPAITVRISGEPFCIPQNALSELLYLGASELPGMLEQEESHQWVLIREERLPLRSLSDLLDLESHRSPQVHPDGGLSIAVVEVDSRRFGLAVDCIAETEEIVVKPLRHGLRELGYYSGATVLSGGELSLILDVAALVAKAFAPAKRTSPPSKPGLLLMERSSAEGPQAWLREVA